MTASDRCPWYGNCNLIQHLLLIFYADPLTRFLNPESSCSSCILGSPSTHLWQKLTKVLQSTSQEAVADLHSKILDARPPLGVHILSISCSFWGNLAKSYVGAPPGELAPLLGEILDPPLRR